MGNRICKDCEYFFATNKIDVGICNAGKNPKTTIDKCTSYELLNRERREEDQEKLKERIVIEENILKTTLFILSEIKQYVFSKKLEQTYSSRFYEFTKGKGYILAINKNIYNRLIENLNEIFKDKELFEDFCTSLHISLQIRLFLQHNLNYNAHGFLCFFYGVLNIVRYKNPAKSVDVYTFKELKNIDIPEDLYDNNSKLAPLFILRELLLKNDVNHLLINSKWLVEKCNLHYRSINNIYFTSIEEIVSWHNVNFITEHELIQILKIKEVSIVETDLDYITVEKL